MSILPRSFYLNPDVVSVSRALLGKVLFSKIEGKLTAGIITETEAYAGVIDKASHAYGGKRTARTEIMYWKGGTAYVYLCYGIHSLFNVVTNEEGIPHAVVVRAIYPVVGATAILLRRKKEKMNDKIAVGPGNVAQALSLHYNDIGKNLLVRDNIWIEDHGIEFSEALINVGTRIGVSYAAEDAMLPYRFWVEHSKIKRMVSVFLQNKSTLKRNY